MSVIDGEARSANALAQENCELLSMKSNDFLALLKNNGSILDLPLDTTLNLLHVAC